MSVYPGEKKWFYCEACDVTYLYGGNEQPGHKEPDTEICCRQCRASLGHLRCDTLPPAQLKQWSGKHLGRMAHE